ncbi:MAG: hypothetical protein WB495_26335 [Xanthobacteraceae bacterium]
MAEPVLNSPRIVAVIRQLIAAGVAQHMDVDREQQAGARANTFDKPIEGIGPKRGAAPNASCRCKRGYLLSQRLSL